MRVVIADDEALVRDGLDRLLREAGITVLGTASDAGGLRRLVEATLPDVAIVDIRMPPTHTDEGILVAEQIRDAHPDVGVLVLSHFLESRYAMRLLEQRPAGAGYLLKERVSSVAVLVTPCSASTRVSACSTPRSSRDSWPGRVIEVR